MIGPKRKEMDLESQARVPLGAEWHCVTTGQLLASQRSTAMRAATCTFDGSCVNARAVTGAVLRLESHLRTAAKDHGEHSHSAGEGQR